MAIKLKKLNEQLIVIAGAPSGIGLATAQEAAKRGQGRPRGQAPVSITLIEPTAVDTPDPQQARNYVDKEAKLPPPMIQPERRHDAVRPWPMVAATTSSTSRPPP